MEHTFTDNFRAANDHVLQNRPDVSVCASHSLITKLSLRSGRYSDVAVYIHSLGTVRW